MKQFVKIENGVVVQKQPYHEEGFIEATDDVVCGQISRGNGVFENPPPKPRDLTPKPLTLEERLIKLEAEVRSIKQVTLK